MQQGDPYAFTYAYDQAQLTDPYLNDPYAMNTGQQYGVAQGDTYLMVPSEGDAYGDDDYGDYPAQLPQVTAMSPGGVRPDIIDSLYSDIDSGDIYDTLSGMGDAKVLPVRAMLAAPQKDYFAGAKVVTALGMIALVVMYSAAPSRR